MFTFKTVKPLGGLLKRLDMRHVIEVISAIDRHDAEQLGQAIILCICERLEDCADDVVKLAAAYKGVTVEEAENLDVIETLTEMVSDTGFMGFFKRAALKAIRESSN